MKKFHFEKDLGHQTQAVESTIGVFENLEIKKDNSIDKNHINPYFDVVSCYNENYVENIKGIQKQNNIDVSTKEKSNIIDIMMETGTGKTYTYTKTIFELYK